MDDPLLLARIQFAANISFHILFPTITIALGWVLLFFKWKFTKTQNEAWMEAYRFWVKVFALSFALGVVSGVTMSFQFGTNWPGFMQTVGNIAGPLLAYEVLTAFFLEATFLGVMLFGFKRVGNFWHSVATFLVAFGTTMSAFWILVLNSWMQTPVGFEMINGQAHATDWLAIIFNPSMPYRLTHMILASFLTVSFLLAGLAAFRKLKGDHSEGNTKSLLTGLWMGAVLMPLQAFVGDLHGLNTLEYQPAKIAAIEAVWHTEKGAPLVLMGIPDESTQSTHHAVEIPKLASLILTHDPNGEIKGLSSFEHTPPVAPLFYGFRLMVGVGLLMWAVSWASLWIYYKKPTWARKSYYVLPCMTFSGWVATLAGWYVTEIGRQPWLVYGVLKTSEAAGNVSPTLITTSLGLYLTIYVGLLLAYISTLFYMAKKQIQTPSQETPL